MTNPKHTDTSRSGDLVERLRKQAYFADRSAEDAFNEAADRIEALEAEVERLKEEMQRIADSCPKCGGRGAYKHRRRMVDCEFCETARAALAGDSHD